MIKLVEYFNKFFKTTETSVFSKVELWTKLQICMIQAFAFKNQEYGEFQNGIDTMKEGPISKEFILNLASVISE